MPCSDCGRVIIYRRGYYTLGPMHLSCSKSGEPSEWVLENCRFPIPWNPIPDKLEGSDANGWLSLEGDFYGCSWMVHIGLGRALARHFYGKDKTDLHLEKMGWMHITPSGFWMSGGLDFEDGKWTHDKYEDATQRQIDALWDWFQTLEPTEKYGTAYHDLKFFFQRMSEGD